MIANQGPSSIDLVTLPRFGLPALMGANTNEGGTAQVPIVTGSTAPSVAPVQQTGTPTPTNVQGDPTASTVLTSAGGVLGAVKDIVTNPSQHIIGVIVLLVVGWFVWKHVK